MTKRQLEYAQKNRVLVCEELAERGQNNDERRTLKSLLDPTQTEKYWQLLRVRTKQGGIKPLFANRAQLEFEKNAGKKNIVLKARQMGVTTWIAARFFVRTITQPGTLTVQVAHSLVAAEEIFRIVHRFWEHMPDQYRNGALKPSRANARQLAFPLLDSEYRVETAGDREAGRGLTIQNLHCSEVARWPGDPRETLASLRAAVAPEGEIVLESTPDGAYGCFYEEWTKAAETGFVRHFFPWWWEPSYVRPTTELVLNSEEEEIVRREGLTQEQIAFRREIHANFRRLAKQEYAEDAETCFRASGDCYFDVDSIDQRLAELAEGEESRLQTFLGAQTGKDYAIGVDVGGENAGDDYCCAQVIELKTGQQCAELHGRWSQTEFADELIKLGREYGVATLVVERNNQGHGISALLEERRYPKLYEEKGVSGLMTTSGTRPRMLARLAALAVEHPALFNSRALMLEMRSFVRKESGRAEAAGGAHDDRVMAMAIAHFARCDREI
jgi:hypothetical protein